ncbi:YSIRK-type signal peptide-containing protein [Limosilactobacillus reuteri]|uniref:YSIRK-type signal peptide-containing protein n=1 Tax=Limosilactobacillus reuteri TaxID=1598 RepID=UPI001E53D8CA|nr:YSIRK-type signal peptide-containing protein [Limosilactobacillus reuteri]MCC4502702.1 YSIRK-type signal peptide-containing protein [Limosilactobacillus reuteri]
MLSRNNHQEQFKKYEPKKQRFTIKKLSVGVASVLLGISFANGVSADTTDASADTNANNGDGSEQTDHNLVLNSANNQTLKEATAANQASGATATSQNPAGDVQTPAANEYEAAVNAAVASQTAQNNTVESAAVANSANSVTTSAASVTQPTSTSTVSQQSAASQTAVETSAAPESTVANTQDASTATQTFSPRSFALNDADMARLLGTSLVATNTSATDIDDYQANFNLTENPEYQQYFAAIPADQYAFQSYEVLTTGQKIIVTTDRNNIGNNIRFYNVRNGSAQLVYQMTRDTQINASGAVVRNRPSKQGTFTTTGVANNSTYKGGTYNWSLNQTDKVNFAGIGTLKIGRIDITAGNSNSPVDNGTGAFVTDDAHRITITVRPAWVLTRW